MLKTKPSSKVNNGRTRSRTSATLNASTKPTVTQAKRLIKRKQNSASPTRSSTHRRVIKSHDKCWQSTKGCTTALRAVNLHSYMKCAIYEKCKSQFCCSKPLCRTRVDSKCYCKPCGNAMYLILSNHTDDDYYS